MYSGEYHLVGNSTALPLPIERSLRQIDRIPHVYAFKIWLFPALLVQQVGARSFKLRAGLAQLHVLRHSRGSPDCGAEEQDRRLRFSPILVELNPLAVAVLQAEIRKALSHLGSEAKILSREDALAVVSR